ncbi:hypothetical protein GF373_15035, partial [bacterium]|nr:hypothetical protein [bacterium]
IQQLDQENIMEDVVVKVFQLNYLDAREISRDLDNIVESLVGAQMAGGRSGRRGYQQIDVTTEVMADRATNSLIITAPKLAVEQLEKFINSLDSSAADRIVIRTFPLKNGDATEIAQILSEMARSRRTNFYQPTVAADSRTNSIIVAAYESDVKMVKDLIDQLDNDQSLDKETRSYKLENADAIIVKEMMEQLLSDENQNSRYSYYYYRRNSGDQDQIRVVEDQRLNAIFVTAKPQEFPMIERLIEQLDQPIPQSMEEPRVFPVENVRASDLAYLINQLFEEDTGGGRSYFSYYSRGRDQQMMTGLTGKVKVTADPMTNSLIVISGTPRAFGIVESLIEQLDSVSNLGDTRVFQLQNADCTYLAEQLNALFEEDSQAANRGFWFFDQPSQQSESDFSQLIGNVRIVSETRTNSLLVTTNSQYFPAVEQIIEDLDQENEQVLIEILIVELIDSDSNNLGIDWDGNIPVTVNGNYDSSFNNLNIANAAILSDAKFDMVLNFLGRNERTNVVARPNIFTRDNQQAYVEVTTRVPVVTEVAISNNTVVPSINYEDVGLKLTVNPQINSATRVTIDVDLENGQVLENLGLDTQGFTIPALSQRQIQTMLTIENQETAVLSGVIDTTEIESEKGIPGLMHIPLLGNVFKSRKKEQTKTELITFITPYILADIQDRKSILQMHNDRLKRIEDLGPIDHGLIKTGIGE